MVFSGAEQSSGGRFRSNFQISALSFLFRPNTITGQTLEAGAERPRNSPGLHDMMRSIAHVLLLLPMMVGSPASGKEGTEIALPVTVGLYINDIHAVDLSTHSYGVDFYLWFRWKAPDRNPAETFEFMNPFDPEAMVRTVLFDTPKSQPDGSLYQIVRCQGLFTTKFPVNRYPFDRQRIVVSIEDSTQGSSQQRYVPDVEPIKVNQEITLPGYQIGSPKLVVRDKHYTTTFGDLSEPDIASYCRAEFIVPISRPPFPGIFKIFVPILLIIISAGFALLLDPEHVEARIGLSITALLTLVAMQFTMLSGLPEVAYLTLIDEVFLVSFLYVLIVIGTIVHVTRIDQKGAIQGKVGGMAKIVRQGPVTALVLTGAYLITVLTVIMINLLANPGDPT